jgi:hypothetical protein
MVTSLVNYTVGNKSKKRASLSYNGADKSKKRASLSYIGADKSKKRALTTVQRPYARSYI